LPDVAETERHRSFGVVHFNDDTAVRRHEKTFDRDLSVGEDDYGVLPGTRGRGFKQLLSTSVNP
jgi:hypothetical protein